MWRRKNAGEARSSVGSGRQVAEGSGKTARCTAGPAERRLLLSGKMEGAVKLLRAWWEGWKPESKGSPLEVERLVGTDELGG